MQLPNWCPFVSLHSVWNFRSKRYILYRILMPRKWLTRRYCWSGYAHGWNVCAVRCKFARKHIPRRTWVHTVATSCVGRSGTSKSIEQANYCPDNMRAFKSIICKQLYRIEIKDIRSYLGIKGFLCFDIYIFLYVI